MSQAEDRGGNEVKVKARTETGRNRGDAGSPTIPGRSGLSFEPADGRAGSAEYGRRFGVHGNGAVGLQRMRVSKETASWSN